MLSSRYRNGIQHVHLVNISFYFQQLRRRPRRNLLHHLLQYSCVLAFPAANMCGDIFLNSANWDAKVRANRARRNAQFALPPYRRQPLSMSEPPPSRVGLPPNIRMSHGMSNHKGPVFELEGLGPQGRLSRAPSRTPSHRSSHTRSGDRSQSRRPSRTGSSSRHAGGRAPSPQRTGPMGLRGGFDRRGGPPPAMNNFPDMVTRAENRQRSQTSRHRSRSRSQNPDFDVRSKRSRW